MLSSTVWARSAALCGSLSGLARDGAFSMPARVAASKIVSLPAGLPKYFRAAASTP